MSMTRWMKQGLYTSFAATRCDRLVWRLDRKRLRILMYHGVCDDRLAGEPWVPGGFVPQTALANQLAYLRDHADVLPLREAVARLRSNTLPECSVSITFDDGYANNLHLAYPLLQMHGLPATIFLATAYLELGRFFPFDSMRLIQLHRTEKGESRSRPVNAAPDYFRDSLDQVLQYIDKEWSVVEARLSEEQRQTFRPLSVEEIKRFDPQLIELAPHSHRHCILRNETPAQRKQEIALSVEKLEQWTGKPVKLFAYPNGERGDFNEKDKDVLRSLGVESAVTIIRGANGGKTDPLELRRYGVGLYHGIDSFIAEVTGFRSFLKSLTL